MNWTVETQNEIMDAELEALPEGLRARLARIVQLIEDKGLEPVGEPRVRHLLGRLWEIRLKGRSAALSVATLGRRVVIVRVLARKMGKTPGRKRDRFNNGGVAMARVVDMHEKWMKEPKYQKAYVSLEEEFALASVVIGLRTRAGLTQEELARKMGTTQPIIARLESGRWRPSMRTLQSLAEATGSRLLVGFEPVDAKRPEG